MAADRFPRNEEEFIEWFWTGDNQDELIHKLNAYSFNEHCGPSSDFIRREKYSPSIYGFVLNMPSGGPKWYKTIEDHPGQIQLMKIGFTHKDTAPNTGNRMEQVMKEVSREIFKKYETYDAEPSPVFMLPINFVDTRDHFEVEQKIREKIGISVPPDLAKSIGLPVPSEWVFTSKNVTDGLSDITDAVEQQYQQRNDEITRVLTTEIFKARGFSYHGYDTDSRYLTKNVNSLLIQLRALQRYD